MFMVLKQYYSLDSMTYIPWDFSIIASTMFFANTLSIASGSRSSAIFCSTNPLISSSLALMMALYLCSTLKCVWTSLSTWPRPVRNRRVWVAKPFSEFRSCCRTSGSSSSTASIQINARWNWCSRIFNRAKISFVPTFPPWCWISWSFWVTSLGMGSCAVVRNWRKKLPRIWTRVWLLWSL